VVWEGHGAQSPGPDPIATVSKASRLTLLGPGDPR
jgi:hypothetical protein